MFLLTFQIYLSIMNNSLTRVVIVGGGFGGVKTALELSNKRGFEVKLISDNTHFEYHGALYRSAVGHSPKEVFIPLKEVFEDKSNVELIIDRVGYINTDKKIIAGLDGDLYEYDRLVLALGSTVDYLDLSGLPENTYNINTVASTIKLRKKLTILFSKPTRKAVRIAVVGGGATGVELASVLPNVAQVVA